MEKQWRSVGMNGNAKATMGKESNAMAMKGLDLQRISIEAQAALIERRSNGVE